MNNENKIIGKISTTYDGYFATDERELVSADKSKKYEYIKQDLSSNFTDFKLNLVKYSNFEDVYQPLKRDIECEIDDAVTSIDSLIFFNPSIYGKYKTFTFNTDKRSNPIKFHYPIEEHYKFTLTIPKNYIVEELPTNTKSQLGKDDAIFSYTLKQEQNNILIETHFKINRLFYEPSSYADVKSFFNQIYKKSNEQIVLKKIKANK